MQIHCREDFQFFPLSKAGDAYDSAQGVMCYESERSSAFCKVC